MSPDSPEDSRFVPTLLVGLIFALGVALQRDVFFDVMAQAIAMTSLAVLVLALLIPAAGLFELYRTRGEWRRKILAEALKLEQAAASPPPAEAARPTVKMPIYNESPPASIAIKPTRAVVLVNAGGSGAKVLSVNATRNDNRNWL